MNEYFDDPIPVKRQSFGASTPDGAVYVRVAGTGRTLGVQIEPAALRTECHLLAARVMACADVAYLEGQAALARESPVLAAMGVVPAEDELHAAKIKLEQM